MGEVGKRDENEEDCVGKPVTKEQHIKSFSMGPAQHKQLHCPVAIHFINHEVFFTAGVP